MSEEMKMSTDNVKYALEQLASYEPEDIECDDFDIAVSDDQFAQMSIVRIAQLGANEIDTLTEQVRQLREALSVMTEHYALFIEAQDKSPSEYSAYTDSIKLLEATK